MGTYKQFRFLLNCAYKVLMRTLVVKNVSYIGNAIFIELCPPEQSIPSDSGAKSNES